MFLEWTSDDSLPDNAGSYYLTRDVKLTGGWAWNGGTMNLCLNGHAITAKKINDPVIAIAGGTLNLFDEEGGTVTQIDGREATVTVGPGGAFNLYGGTITGATNDYSDPLPGVEVYGSFHMSGGTVTGNPKGVLVTDEGAFTVSGGARVTGNTTCNVYLVRNGRIRIGGALSANARIGVTAYDGVVTSGLPGNGSVESFFSDSDREMIGLNADGEAVIGKPVTVAFAPGDENAAGTMESLTVAAPCRNAVLPRRKAWNSTAGW